MSVQFFGTSKTPIVRSIVFDPRDGYRYVERKSGKPSEIEADFNSARAAGYRCRYDPDAGGGYASLEVEVGRDPAGTTEELSNEWYLLGNDLEKSIYEHPTVEQMLTEKFGTVTAQNRASFRKDVEACVRGEKEVYELVGDYTASAGAIINLEYMISNISLGQETYFVSQFVLRNTVVLPSNYSGTVDISNVNRYYTTAQLFAAESVSIPLIPAIQSLTGEWLKKTPTFEPSGRDKWRVDREWWHADQWSRFSYSAAT